MADSVQSNLRDQSHAVSRGVRWTRTAYRFGVVLLGTGIVLQVFFAGAGVLVDPRYWALHVGFAHAIEYLILGLLLIGFIARLPRRVHGLHGLLFGLFFLQYLFLYAVPNLGLPLLRALHAVNALALFWLAAYLGQWAWRWAR